MPPANHCLPSLGKRPRFKTQAKHYLGQECSKRFPQLLKQRPECWDLRAPSIPKGGHDQHHIEGNRFGDDRTRMAHVFDDRQSTGFRCLPLV
jgi:hypothetical protein